MTDLTPCVRELLRARAPPEKTEEKLEKTEKTVNEFLKEAYRIVRTLTSPYLLPTRMKQWLT